MNRKRKRRSSVVEIGTGPCRVKIYTVNRKDGYPVYSLYWKEGGQRKFRHLACQEEARLIAHQIIFRLANGFDTGNEATKRNLEMLRHFENFATGFGVSLTAAMDEWVSARRTAGEIPIADAVRFYAANRADLVAIRTTAQVADEFIASRQSSGVSDAYVRSARHNLKKFTDRLKGNVTDIAVGDINRFLGNLEGLGPVSRNTIRRNLITMFSFAKKQGYLHPDRKTAAELSESFKEPDTGIEIFTPDEMRRILMAATQKQRATLGWPSNRAGIRGHWGGCEIRNHGARDVQWAEDKTRSGNWVLNACLAILRVALISVKFRQGGTLSWPRIFEQCAHSTVAAFSMINGKSIK